MDGIFLIDKESGCTSRDVVDEIMRKTEMVKVGHTGTLDPLATGVLVVCVGKCTKLVSHLTSSNKKYEAEITLGIDTDSNDITGTIIKEEKVDLTDEQIVEAVNSIKGEYEQEVPIYSAVKVKGKKLYEYARAKEYVELPIRTVNIIDIEIISPLVRKDDKIIFSISCTVSKGTYIRALARDIAKRLNTIGIMSKLRRLTQGCFDISECKKIDDIRISDMKTVKETLREHHVVEVDDILKKAILNGKIIDNIYNRDEILFIDSEDNVLALYKGYEKDKTKIKPYVMIGGIK